MSGGGPRRTPSAQVFATLVVLGVAIVAAGVYIGKNAGGSPSTASSSPTPSTSAASVGPTVSATGSSCSSLVFGAALAPIAGDAGKHSYAAAPPMMINTVHFFRVTLETTKGNILLCLDPQLAPLTVNNFVFLTRNKFYDGIKFHRVVANFVIQGGDPLGTGSGGPGYKFADEPVKGQYVAGAVAMANAGPNTNGSQFFICTADDRASLAKSYNLFGYVEVGMDKVLTIHQGDLINHAAVQEQQR